MKGIAIKYSDQELQFLRDHEKTPRAELTTMFNSKFNRSISNRNIESKCLRMGLKTGRSGVFAKGHTPWNTGTKGVCGIHPNCRRTQFKKGQKSHNAHYFGHERITKDGYVEISVKKVNPYSGYERCYVLKHRYVWESVYGPVPDGMCLRFIDGDRKNCEIDNLELIKRHENLELNKMQYKQLHPHIQPLAKSTAKLIVAALDKRRKISGEIK